MPNNYETYTRVRKATVKAGEKTTVDLQKVDPANPDDIFIRFVPTPQELVDNMMDLGKVGDKDVVYGLEEATVVTMYLSDGLSTQLKPVLLKRLKPGSRIVSHRFLMEGWKPEKTETVTIDGEEYKIHLWTVPTEKDAKKDK